MRITERQWPKERGIDQAENRRRRPDAEAEDRDRCRGEPGGLAQQTEGLADVVMKMHAA